jgi:hypothetical protein
LSTRAAGVVTTDLAVGILGAPLLTLPSRREVIRLVEAVITLRAAVVSSTRILVVRSVTLLLTLFQGVVAPCLLEKLIKLLGKIAVLKLLKQKHHYKAERSKFSST